jgi:hypothetical protein
MKPYLLLGVILIAWVNVSMASTKGGDVVLNNNSSYEMTRTNLSSNQMEKWNFAQSIPAQQSVSTRVEFEWPWLFQSPTDDFGTVSYQISCPDGMENITLHTWMLGTTREPAPGFAIDHSGANCVISNPKFKYGFLLNQNQQTIITFSNAS